MDVQQFGTFLQLRRKELGMKQSDLAEKIHVTDKAVSRWERGVGFPDIKLLEPLAAALDLTLTELIQCRRNTEEVTEEEKENLTIEAERIVEEQKKLSWQRKLILWIGYATIVAAGWVLIYVSRNADLDPILLKVIHGVALVGVWLGCRALQYIVGRLYLKSKPWGIWHNYYTWVAAAMVLIGVRIAVNGWMYDTAAPIWNAVLCLGGIALALGGWIYYEFREEDANN